MNKNRRILSFVLALGLAAGCATAALAEEAPTVEATENQPAVEVATETAPAYYPYAISIQEDGGQMLVVKEYEVPTDVTVAELQEESITRQGQPYALWGVTCTATEGSVEEREVQKSYDIVAQSNIPDEVRPQVKETVEYEEDGFAGTLTLADLICQAEAQADGSYLATCTYAGVITRELPGTAHYTLYYAPVETETITETTPQAPDAALLLTVIAVLLLGVAVVIGIIALRRRTPAPAAKKEEAPPKKVKVYVPNNDIVLGAKTEREEDEDD